MAWIACSRVTRDLVPSAFSRMISLSKTPNNSAGSRTETLTGRFLAITNATGQKHLNFRTVVYTEPQCILALGSRKCLNGNALKRADTYTKTGVPWLR